MSQAGRRAFITGGASGIGAAVAARLARDGAEVVIGDLNLEAAQGHAKEIDAMAVHLDVFLTGACCCDGWARPRRWLPPWPSWPRRKLRTSPARPWVSPAA